MIGNAAAALQGAPVTTLDVDFLFRKTPQNLRKLKGIARDLGAVILRPYYPASTLFRLVRDSDSLQLDFMGSIQGVKSYNSLRSRATPVSFDGEQILVASLSDIIASKRAADRPRDRAVLDVLTTTLKETQAKPERKARRTETRE
jgi:predicted nucleotidyltransferase